MDGQPGEQAVDVSRERDMEIAVERGWTITNREKCWGNRIVYGPFKDCDCPSHCEAAIVPRFSAGELDPGAHFPA